MSQNRNVTLFIPCLVDGVFPEVGESMVRLLTRLGMRCGYPSDQTCCGQPAFNAGYRKEAAVAARRFITVFEGAECIVAPSGSCVVMVRSHYPELLADDPGWRRRAEQVASRTFELTQFLVDVCGIEDVGARLAGKLTYHDSCHLLRGLGVQAQPRRLLARVRDAELIEMQDSDRCCGFGGAFAVKYPVISTAMVDDKVDNIIATGADAVVGADMGCLMNIQGRLSRRGVDIEVLHIAQVLAG